VRRWTGGDGRGTQVVRVADLGLPRGKIRVYGYYAAQGLYTVSLQAKDEDGGASLPVTFTVQVRNLSPLVEAGPDQTVRVGQSVSFSGAYSDLGNDTHTIVWDFGDGTAATGNLTPTHAYARPGTYTVLLTVTDHEGGVGVETLRVDVRQTSAASPRTQTAAPSNPRLATRLSELGLDPAPGAMPNPSRSQRALMSVPPPQLHPPAPHRANWRSPPFRSDRASYPHSTRYGDLLLQSPPSSP